jgi:hypothetical protein
MHPNLKAQVRKVEWEVHPINAGKRNSKFRIQNSNEDQGLVSASLRLPVLAGEKK